MQRCIIEVISVEDIEGSHPSPNNGRSSLSSDWPIRFFARRVILASWRTLTKVMRMLLIDTICCIMYLICILSEHGYETNQRKFLPFIGLLKNKENLRVICLFTDLCAGRCVAMGVGYRTGRNFELKCFHRRVGASKSVGCFRLVKNASKHLKRPKVCPT